MKDYILEVENLVKHFSVKGGGGKVVHAVDGVSLRIKRGRTLGLVGESGCGKSTLARTIIRIYDPTAGKIWIDGRDIANLSQRQLKPVRKKIQMIFQDPFASLNARMTVKDIIAEPLRAHQIGETSRERDELIYEILAKVGLERGHANRYAHEFSGGQRQRIGIARALILRPEIIICDEPISALDVSIQAQVVNMLLAFQRELQLTYLFIAHDLSMVRYVSDDVGVMYLGKLVEFSSGSGVYQNPLHPYTQGLIQSAPAANPEAARNKKNIPIEGDIPSPISPPPGCRFHTRCKYAAARCKTEEPVLKDAGDGHWTACHLHV
ncbi:MAG: ATP-binding cassette domain-containing protein [Spirochaetaceae bacterium]|jgi:oligopeptide transport system ATP-binding protein|nr:ATP-binding cassette domain-containing protein [Spirochaetaceae bacterium]